MENELNLDNYATEEQQLEIIRKNPLLGRGPEEHFRAIPNIASEKVWKALLDKSGKDPYSKRVLTKRPDTAEFFLEFAKRGKSEFRYFIKENLDIEQFAQAYEELKKFDEEQIAREQEAKRAQIIKEHPNASLLGKEELIKKIRRDGIGYRNGGWHIKYLYYQENGRIPDDYINEEWFQMEIVQQKPFMMQYFGDDVLRKICRLFSDNSKANEPYYTSIVRAIEFILQNKKEEVAEECIDRLINIGVIKALRDKGNETVKKFISDNPKISDSVEIMGTIADAIESAENEDPTAINLLCDYARKGALKAIDYIVDHIDNDECWRCFADIALTEGNTYTQIDSVINRRWLEIIQLADGWDDEAQKIVLRYYKKDEKEVYPRAVLWAKEGNPFAKKLVLECCPEEYIRELAEYGDLDALKCLAILGDKDAIDKMVAMGDWETIKESTVRKEDLFRGYAAKKIAVLNSTYALEKLVVNDRITEIEEMFPTIGIKLIEIIDQLGKLETVRNATAINSVLQNAIVKYCQCKTKTVEIGSIVTVRDCATNKETSYCIVDKKRERFTHDVPQVHEVPVNTYLGARLYGKKFGSMVEIQFNVGIKLYEIIDIN